MIVFDTSAVMAILFEEPGGDIALAAFPEGILCTANATEVISRLIDAGETPDRAVRVLTRLRLPIIPFDAALAIDAGLLRATTRSGGLSLGDRACIALARARSLPVLTGDRIWA
ncbi:MAG: type II toxin-antitoxin system VapC family toxin, partial [Sphingomonadaceae bacterium]|nr:type II toxin-antitoxin system VapC family toxin [Sphingomonadaceae bacterium]